MQIQASLRWLEGTAGSVAIRESLLLYPFIETTHVLMLCLFLGMIALLDLRLLGVGLRGVPVSQVAGRLLPWALAGFVAMTISGMLLFYSGPVRAAGNIFFQIKIAHDRSDGRERACSFIGPSTGAWPRLGLRCHSARGVRGWRVSLPWCSGAA